jgi:LysR family transcriptional regulator, carnitine catabolism transcriptional activator
VFTAFQQRWPQVRIDPVDVPTDQIIGSVETGQADLAVSFNAPVGDAIEVTPLFISRVHAVFHSGHPLGRRKSVQWEDLNSEPIIFIGRGSELRIRSELPDHVNLVSRYEVNNTITALALVASGAGVAICAGYVKPMTRMHGLRSIPLTDPVVDRAFMLYRNRSRAMAPAVASYQDFLLDHYASLGTRPVEESLLR